MSMNAQNIHPQGLIDTDADMSINADSGALTEPQMIPPTEQSLMAELQSVGISDPGRRTSMSDDRMEDVVVTQRPLLPSSPPHNAVDNTHSTNAASFQSLQKDQKHSSHLSINPEEMLLKIEETEGDITRLLASLQNLKDGNEFTEFFDKTKLVDCLNQFPSLKLSQIYHDDMRYDYDELFEVIAELKKSVDDYSNSIFLTRQRKKTYFEKEFINYNAKIERLFKKISSKAVIPLDCVSRKEELDQIDLDNSTVSTNYMSKAGVSVSEAHVVLHEYMFQYHAFAHLLNHTIRNIKNTVSTDVISNTINAPSSYEKYVSNMKFTALEYDSTWNILNMIFREHSEQTVVRLALEPMIDQMKKDNDDVYKKYKLSNLSNLSNNPVLRRLSSVGGEAEQPTQDKSTDKSKSETILGTMFVTFLIAQRDLFLRTSEMLDGIIEFMPSELVTKVKLKMDNFIKEKLNKVEPCSIPCVTSSISVRPSKHHLLLQGLYEQSENIDKQIRNAIEKSVITRHNMMVKEAKKTDYEINETIPENMKNRNRRVVQLVYQFLRNPDPKDDIYDTKFYQEKLIEINVLMQRMSKCGNALSKALEAQKVAFMQQCTTAKEIVRIYRETQVLRAATEEYEAIFSIGSRLYLSSAESLCIELSLCPMSLLIKTLLFDLRKDLMIRQTYVLDLAGATRRGNKNEEDIFQKRLDACTEKIKKVLKYMEDEKLDENLFFEMLCVSVIGQFEFYTYLATKMSILIDGIESGRLKKQMQNAQNTLNEINSSPVSNEMIRNSSHSMQTSINSRISKNKKSVSVHNISMRCNNIVSNLCETNDRSFKRPTVISKKISQESRRIAGSSRIGYITSKLDDAVEDYKQKRRKSILTDLYDIKMSSKEDKCFTEYYDAPPTEKIRFRSFVTARRPSLPGNISNRSTSPLGSAEDGL